MRMQQSQNEKLFEEVEQDEETQQREKGQRLEKKKTQAQKEESKPEKKGILGKINIFKNSRPKQDKEKPGKDKLAGKRSPKGEASTKSAQKIAKSNPNSNIPRPR